MSRLLPDRAGAPAIAGEEFARRRRQLMQMAGEDAVLLVAAAPERTRNADATWPYRQDSDFHYLAGFPEPDAVLALLPGRLHGEVVLFCRERDAEQARWHGRACTATSAASPRSTRNCWAGCAACASCAAAAWCRRSSWRWGTCCTTCACTSRVPS